MDAWALTDHGNGNGHAHAKNSAAKIQKKGIKYRQLYGVEFYFVPSLTQWSLDYEAHKQSIKDAKSAAEAEKRAKTPTDVDADEEEQGGLVVEDENETKTVDVKSKDWQRRYHLVAVAKNKNGLANLYRLVKLSYKDGFYRYPRIDFDLLSKYGSDIIWSSACLTGDAKLVTDRGTETLLSVIERYRLGENPMVLSFNEECKELQFKRVLWGDKTRSAAKIVMIKMADGKEVRLTPDHQVLTDKGWLRSDELKKNIPVKILSL